MPLKLNTKVDLIESKGHRRKLELSSFSGNIRAKTSAEILAESWSGNISVDFSSVGHAESSSFSTESGSIYLAFIDQPQVNINIDTHGSITTDYSIEIKPQAGGDFKNAFVRQDGAKAKIKVTSNTGAVHLKRISSLIEVKE